MSQVLLYLSFYFLKIFVNLFGTCASWSGSKAQRQDLRSGIGSLPYRESETRRLPSSAGWRPVKTIMRTDKAPQRPPALQRGYSLLSQVAWRTPALARIRIALASIVAPALFLAAGTETPNGAPGGTDVTLWGESSQKLPGGRLGLT